MEYKKRHLRTTCIYDKKNTSFLCSIYTSGHFVFNLSLPTNLPHKSGSLCLEYDDINITLVYLSSWFWKDFIIIYTDGGQE